jgi:2-dehydro-3-deoxyphosphooctonate aldolase (KDO 8-P synthase)
MFLIAGPCAIESREIVMQTAAHLKEVCERLDIQLYFKSSFDKANRTSLSDRGIGMEKGLEILQEVKDTYGLPILTDVHESWQCEQVAKVADVLQIPAFLARQTDLLVAAARTGKIVNVKKGQFMAPWDMRGAITKIEATWREGDKAKGESRKVGLWLTERGSSFGYGNIVVDMTSLVKMREYGYPVVFDATHAVQQPSSQAGVTGGNREMVPHLMRAALAVGIDGLFLEVHPDPDKAISDAANQVRLCDIESILEQAIAIDKLNKQLLGL